MAVAPLKYALPSGQRPTPEGGAPRAKPVAVTIINGRFLKGPVSLEWFFRAGRLAGKSLHVGVALWFLVGVQKKRCVSLSNKLAGEFGVDRHAKGRALRALERAGLISVRRKQGCSPLVTVLEVAADE